MTVTIFDIKRFAVHDGPGIRTTVFLKGCPLRCWWCHNPESQESKPVTVDIMRKVNGKNVPGKKVYGERMEVDELMEILIRDRHFYEESEGGITFSGGEPLMQPDALALLLESCKKHGLHTTVDTSGYVEKKIEAFYCHKTQAKDYNRILSREGFREFCRRETYVLAKSRLPPGPLPESDLFAGIPPEEYGIP